MGWPLSIRFPFVNPRLPPDHLRGRLRRHEMAGDKGVGVAAEALFGDKRRRRQFLDELERQMNAGDPEAALAAALRMRGQSSLARAYPLPEPEGVIASARLRGYRADDPLGRGRSLQSLINANRACTAIGFDLSAPSHFDDGHRRDPLREPVVEVGVHSDDDFPFSTMTRERLLDQLAGSGGRRLWQGAADADAVVVVEGLGPLYGARERLPDQRDAAEEELFDLDSAIAAIAFHLLVRREVRHHGSPGNRAILTGSHDDRPNFRAIVATRNELEVEAASYEASADAPPGRQERRERDDERRERKAEAKRRRDDDLARGLEEFGLPGRLFEELAKRPGNAVSPVKAIRAAGPLALLAGLALLGAGRKKR